MTAAFAFLLANAPNPEDCPGGPGQFECPRAEMVDRIKRIVGQP